MTNANRMRIIGSACGATLVAATSVVFGARSLGFVPFILWGLSPWGVLALARFPLDAWSAAGASAAMLVVEGGVRASVFLYPRGSTAAIALVFSPVVVAASALPGAAAGWVIGRAWKGRSPILGAVASIVFLCALGLTLLGLARPEFFPTAVARRRATLGRIGEPRVVSGGETFEKVLVSERAAWHVSGKFDDGPGEVLAVVDHHGAEFFDPMDLRPRGRRDFAGKAGALWNWFSTLALVDGRLVVVQTGGGYSDVEVRGLDSSLLWSYRPDHDLPPTALKPADLDGDGKTEFYASDRQAVVRLDGDGRVVWRRAAQMAHLVGIAPRTSVSPAWVVGVEYARVVRVWNDGGQPLGEIPVGAGDSVYGVVDWRGCRALILGGKSLRGIDLSGKPVFEIPLGEFVLSEAITVKLKPQAPAYLAVVSSAPRDVARWRLLILLPEHDVVYDEIFAKPLRVLKSRGPDGSEALFLSSEGLSALRLRRRPN